MDYPIPPDIPSENESFFGVVHKSAIQIVFGACISILHQYLGIELATDRMFGLLAPNIMLALAGVGERIVQTLQGVYAPLLLDHGEERLETPFGVVEFFEAVHSVEKIEETQTQAPSPAVPSPALTVPTPSPLPETFEITKSAEIPVTTFEISALESPLIVDVDKRLPPDELSQRTSVMIKPHDDVIHEACVIVCAVFVGFISASLLFRRSGQNDESDTASSERAASLVTSTTNAAKATRRRRTTHFNYGLAEDLVSNPADSDAGDDGPSAPPPTSAGARKTRMASGLVSAWSALGIPLGKLKSFMNQTVRRKILTTPASQSAEATTETSSARTHAEELLGVGEQWDTLSGFCQTVPASPMPEMNARQGTIHEESRAPATPSGFLSGFKNALRFSRISALWNSTFFKGIAFLVPAAGLTYIAGAAFSVPVAVLFAVFKVMYAKKDVKAEPDIENQLDNLRQAFEDDPQRNNLLAKDYGSEVDGPPLVILEEEDDRPCRFGHEPVLEYAPVENQETVEETPAAVRETEIFTPDSPSTQEELPLRLEPSAECHAEENDDDSIVVCSTELSDVFQAAASVDASASPREHTVNSVEGCHKVAAPEEDDLVTSLIISAAQSSDNIVILTVPAGSQVQSDEPETLQFVVETVQGRFLGQDAPLIGLSAARGQAEEDDTIMDVADDASVCSDVGSYITAGDSDDEREEMSPMTTDDEDLESYHSSVEDVEEDDVVKGEAISDLQVNQANSTSLVAGLGLVEHLVDLTAQENSTPTKQEKVTEEKHEEDSEGSLYELCPQKSGVRYIDDSDVDVDEPEPVVAKSPATNWSRIPRFSFGSGLFTSRSIHRFEVLNTIPPLSNLRRAPSVFDSPSIRRSASLAALFNTDISDTEPTLTPKGRMMKLKDRQLKGKLKDMSGVKERENAGTKSKVSNEGPKPRFSI